jgi:hypothetical protein
VIPWGTEVANPFHSVFGAFAILSFFAAVSATRLLASAITQAGGWKSTRMPLQYAEKIHAARSGMARAAAASGRDEAASDEG